MMGKPAWPVLGLSPPNIREHGTLLLLHLNSMLSRVQNKENPPLSIVETLLKDTIAYLEKAKEEPKQIEILEAIQKMSLNALQHHQRTEENFTIVKSSISNAHIFQPQSSKSPNTTGTKTYASLLHNLHSPQSIPPNPTRPTINKDLEIVVRLNSSEQKAILKDVSTDIILKDLNTRIESMGYRTLRAVKRLPSGDFAVLTINNEEAEKLRNNSHWAGA